MPADIDRPFYDMLESIANTKGDEDAVQQNKRIKEAEFAEDSREPTEEEIQAIRRELHKGENADKKPVASQDREQGK